MVGGSGEGLSPVFGWNRVGIVKNIFYPVKPSFSQGNRIFFLFFFFLLLFVFICICWLFGIRDFCRALFGMYDRQLETPWKLSPCYSSSSEVSGLSTCFYFSQCLFVVLFPDILKVISYKR